MLSLVLAESSIELVPKELQDHSSVSSHAKKLGKKPSEILLDNSWHFAAMKGIPNEIKRGRPDLVHFCLLEATSIPLFDKNKIQIFVHTIDDNVILLHQNVKLPKSYHRFEGLVEKLFKEKTVKSKNQTLLELQKMTFPELIKKIKPSQIIGLSTNGKESTYSDVASELDDQTCLVIGGFQKGHFSKSTEKLLRKLYKVEETPREAHLIVGRILYEYEKTIFM